MALPVKIDPLLEPLLSQTGGATADEVLPAVPTGLRVDSIAMNRIQLVWTDASDNEDGFAIEGCAQRGCNNFLEIGRVFPNQQAFLDTQLFANTQYYDRIRAFSVGGYSAYTDVVSAKALKK